MSLSPFNQPDYSSDSGTQYPTNIDDCISVLTRIGAMFAPQAQDTPNMTVKVNAGWIYTGAAITEVTAQNTGMITAPSTNPRIDRVVVDKTTGTVSVITGSEGASPSAPALTVGKLPVGQIYLTVGMTEITNADLTDERVFHHGPSLADANTFSSANTFSGKIIYPDAGELTISSGEITPTGVNHSVDTESDASADDLDTITAGSDGQILMLRCENSSRAVTVLHGTGNIQTPDGRDITLDNTRKSILLKYDDDLSVWLVLSSIGGGGATPVATASWTGGSPSQIDINNVFTAGNCYEVHFESDDASGGPDARLSDDGGSSFQAGASDYKYGLLTVTSAGSNSVSNQTATTIIPLRVLSGAAKTWLFFYDPARSDQKTSCNIMMTNENGDAAVGGACLVDSDRAVDSIRFLTLSGAGKISVYERPLA